MVVETECDGENGRLAVVVHFPEKDVLHQRVVNEKAKREKTIKCFSCFYLLIKMFG